MTSIRIFYKDRSSETVSVTNYRVSNGWLTYVTQMGARKEHSIPSSEIHKVETV